ncbi:hypothetical protein L8W66_03785, partial [Campylobacter lari]|nr:hypothetical protein [Campylobacter lari]MCV3441566.1 hypothetical protein [Campylobacter lari]
MSCIDVAREKISYAIFLWDFQQAIKLYENFINLDRELLDEYLSFLFNLGYFDQVIYNAEKYNIKNVFYYQAKRIKKQKFKNIKNIEKEYQSGFALYILRSSLKYGFKVEIALKEYHAYFRWISTSIQIKYFIAYLIDCYFTFNLSEVKLSVANSLYGILYSYSDVGSLIYQNKYIFFYQNIFNINMQKNYRVAICISGALRGEYKITLNNIYDKIAKPLKADIFLFSWELAAIKWPGITGGSQWITRVLPKYIQTQCPDFLKETHNFKKLMPYTFNKLSIPKLEKINNKLNKRTRGKKSFSGLNFVFNDFFLENENDFNQRYNGCTNMFKMWYGIHKVFSLMQKYENENNIRYDYIIRIRPDILVENKITKHSLFNVRFDSIELIRNYVSGLPHDLYAFGTRSVMEHYMNFWEISNDIAMFKQHQEMSAPHSKLHEYLLGFGIKTCISKIRYSFQNIGEILYKGYQLPNITQELEYDLNSLSSKFSKEDILKIKDFFGKLIYDGHLRN